MPLYEYQCGKCNRAFESYKRPSDDGERERCPVCGESCRRMGISVFRAGGRSGAASPGGSSCGRGPGRSPFG